MADDEGGSGEAGRDDQGLPVPQGQSSGARPLVVSQ